MAPPAKKRRTTRAAAKAEAEQEKAQPAPQAEPEHNTEEEEQPQPESKPEPPAPTSTEPTAEPTTEAATKPAVPEPEPEPEKPSAADAAAKAKERMARFKALQARAKTSSETNLKEATKESQRLASDPSQLTALHRKHAIASHKLLKADVEEAGEDFERKRAWDWTIDESEKWDKRLKKKAAHRDNNAFRDNHQESNKVYKRQLQNINPDLENYDKQKLAAIEKAAASGGLDIVEMEDGELIAVDKDGSFYSTADTTSFAQNKPDKAAVDRLVEDLRRADEQRLKKRKERMAKNGDEGDVTYINEKNKQFNQKLSRFYDKYTADIRDSFERGTMI
ncbi:Pre-mRNA-splicing factor SYF2 [Purpureocillium takamizusanense]|uniref:Pre-mRNA-splicing factor SYF2 n=1 Tax=Purpureocillium takamizusanense TaxID=2060973 RepID=A0A9Q8V6W9_9HYPO|nr:Pre-mRNA-splicing factor SYF2 [Purpureocillium takamizusanense]UNI14269.1 Pre-mRNA-splicing factor SYF2 [Purpureocillium takamizusanense]